MVGDMAPMLPMIQSISRHNGHVQTDREKSGKIAANGRIRLRKPFVEATRAIPSKGM
jgi:hypothetical protein